VAAAVYTDYKKMLREAPIDAVDICSTHATHAELAVAAAEAGKHVLVEKPMACSMTECRAMVAAAERSGVKLMVAQFERYIPAHRALKKCIADGELGTVRGLQFDYMQNFPDAVRREHWLFDGKEAGGGAVISIAVHRIDLMRYLVGDIRRVSGSCRTINPRFFNGAEDYAVATLEFENGRGGAIGAMFTTYSGARMPWATQYMIFGDEGAVHAVPQLGEYSGKPMIASRRRDGGVKEWGDMFKGFVPVEAEKSEMETEDPFINQVLHFEKCCRTGEEPWSGGKDNLNTMATVFGIYASSANGGRPVELAEM
jgi:predicted dehydrogenase